jgi:hypothetical protein
MNTVNTYHSVTVATVDAESDELESLVERCVGYIFDQNSASFFIISKKKNLQKTAKYSPEMDRI